ncbi:unnamed protein product [Mytilus edulis]|uniref:CCHC-type domain-containing protein n=1 Tax=Mytilus edulis TaxID=6550 RepID=A0A8S3SE52_MYTED|nr:unnamed protein product [Mytilus edulis]
MHDRWRNVVFRVRFHRTVKFNEFVNFCKSRSQEKATHPTYGNIAMNYSNSRSTNQQRQHGQKVSNVCDVAKNAHTEMRCSYCEGTHALDKCKRLTARPREDRIAYLKSKGYCFGCLKKGHMSNKCNRRLKCSICARLHPTILHNDNQINKQSVKLNNRSQSVETYAFFDSGSSITFCSQKLMQQLGANGKKTQITISTMGNTQTINTCAINGLQVSSLSMEHMVDLPKVYTKENLPVSKEHIPTRREIKKWTHLESVDIPEIDADIGIMIGNNVPDAYTPFNVCTGPSGSPHATKTRLGWILWNVIRDSSSFEVNRVHMQHEGCDETQLNLLMQSINLDFPERMTEDKRENSIDDKIFMQQVESSIHLENQHYCIALPFRDQDVVFPNNSVQGIKRLNGLRHKFAKNDNFKQQYCDFMSKIIEERLCRTCTY